MVYAVQVFNVSSRWHKIHKILSWFLHHVSKWVIYVAFVWAPKCLELLLEENVLVLLKGLFCLLVFLSESMKQLALLCCLVLCLISTQYIWVCAAKALNVVYYREIFCLVSCFTLFSSVLIFPPSQEKIKSTFCSPFSPKVLTKSMSWNVSGSSYSILIVSSALFPIQLTWNNNSTIIWISN